MALTKNEKKKAKANKEFLDFGSKYRKSITISEFLDWLFTLNKKECTDLTYVLDDIPDAAEEGEPAYQELYEYAAGIFGPAFKEKINKIEIGLEDSTVNNTINTSNDSKDAAVSGKTTRPDERVEMSDEVKTICTPEQLAEQACDTPCTGECTQQCEVTPAEPPVEEVAEVVTPTAEPAVEEAAQDKEEAPKPRKRRSKVAKTVLPVGNKLQQMRKDQGLSQVAVATKLGVTQGYLSWIERNNLHVKEDMLNKIAEVFGVTKEQFLEGIEPVQLNAEPSEATQE